MDSNRLQDLDTTTSLPVVVTEGDGMSHGSGGPFNTRPQRRTRHSLSNSNDFFYREASPPPARPSRGLHRSGSTAAGAGPTGPAKIKIKLTQDAVLPYMAQKYDRSIDSDPDEPLVMEEHFILRLPSGGGSDVTDQVREVVANREVGSSKARAGGREPWFRFRDSRRAVFGYGRPDKPNQSRTFTAKLVDLPCIIESHKTLDYGKHLYKVADINQMLVVEDELQPGQDPGLFDDRNGFDVEEFVYPHGLAPPLQHVRKRRFRKRTNKRTIENVERAVEDLFSKDSLHERTEYELFDPNEMMDDSTLSPSTSMQGRTPGAFDTESLGAPTPGPSDMLDDDRGQMADLSEDDGNDFSSQDGIDDDLAAELEQGLQPVDEDESNSDDSANVAVRNGAAGSDSDMGDLFGSAGESEEENRMEDQGEGDQASAESRRRARLLGDEVRDLEGAVARKAAEISKASNPIIKRRFEDSLRKLTTELELKKAQLANLLAEPQDNEEEDEEEDPNVQLQPADET